MISEETRDKVPLDLPVVLTKRSNKKLAQAGRLMKNLTVSS